MQIQLCLAVLATIMIFFENEWIKKCNSQHYATISELENNAEFGQNYENHTITGRSDSTIQEFQNSRRPVDYECVQIREGYSIYMKNSCPLDWTNQTVRNFCRDPKTKLLTNNNYFKKNDCPNITLTNNNVPVTSGRTNITYLNHYCAICNNETADGDHQIKYWHIAVYKTSNNSVNPTENMLDVVKRWNDGLNCQKTYVVYPIPPSHFDPNIFQSCQNLKKNTLLSIPPRFIRISNNTSGILIAVLFNVSKMENCDRNENVGPNFLVFKSQSYTPACQICNKSTKGCQISILIDYDYFLVPPNEQKFPINLSDPTQQMSGIFYKNSTSDTGYDICVTPDIIKPDDPFMLTLAFFGPIVLIAVHLVAFPMYKYMQTLPGKNLTCFCLSLLAAYCCFIGGNFFTGLACFYDGVVSYYFFLASYCWSLSISFDVRRTILKSVHLSKNSIEIQNKMFQLYSIYSWGLPLALALMAIIVDTSDKGSIIADEYRPFFQHNKCWFASGWSMFIFLDVPFGVMAIISTAMYMSSFCIIYYTPGLPRQSACQKFRTNFLRLYGTLALLSTVTAVIGIAGLQLKFQYFDYLFAASNNLLGIYIFCCFTCRRSTLNAVTKMYDENTLMINLAEWSVKMNQLKRNRAAKKELAAKQNKPNIDNPMENVDGV